MLMRYERELITEYGRKLSESGLCPGTSGNLSIRDPHTGHIAISPSGMDYMQLIPEDIPILDISAAVIDGNRKPSSEWALHTELYKLKPEMNAVIHTHSIYCTVLSVLGEPLRAVHFAIGAAGASIVPCAPYALFGTMDLAQKAAACCGKSKAVLLANHGMVCCDTDIASAFGLCKNLEYVAELQYKAMAAGSPMIISDDAMQEVLAKFSTYGQPDQTKDL